MTLIRDTAQHHSCLILKHRCICLEDYITHISTMPWSPHPLQLQKRKGRLINRRLQSMKTGGNNPDKRQIWSLSYKTNFNCTPFFKSSSEWRTGELKPCGCRICFSLIALSGYLTQCQMTKIPPVTDRLSLCLSQSILCVFTHVHTHPLTLPSFSWCTC